MMKCGLVSCLLISVLTCALANPFWNKFSDLKGSVKDQYQKRSSSRIIDQCILVGLEETSYFYKSSGESTVCGLYLVTSPEERLEITLESLKANCETGLVSLLDGWELSGEVFPSPEEVPMEGRIENFCGTASKKLFVTESNAATILYRLPTPGDKFRISVRFIEHPKPCNVFLTGDSTMITLRNHGLRRNCSVAMAKPSSIKILQLSIGPGSKTNTRLLHYHSSLNCEIRGREDWLEIGGASGLDTYQMTKDQTVCGVSSQPKLPWSRIFCDVSAVRLVSSGYYENSVTIAMVPITDLEFAPTTICQQEA